MATTKITNTMNATERRDLKRASETIHRGLATFVDVGLALAVIRDGRLYRDRHKTFAAYCRDQWGLDKSHAGRLISAAAVTEVVPIGATRPANEAQARPLTKLATPEDQVAAWATVIETAPKNQLGQPLITGRHVAKVVQNMTSTKAAEGPADTTEEPPGATDGAAEGEAVATCHDYLGQAVPDHVALAFHEEYKLDECEGAVELVAKNVATLVDSPAGAHFDRQVAKAAIDTLRRLISAARPFALCPRCAGLDVAKCDLCDHAGQVTEQVHQAEGAA